MSQTRNTAFVILYFNKPAMTARCQASVHAVAGTDANVVLVDNGSTSAKLAPATIRLDQNRGFARGMNAGLRYAFRHPSISLVTLLSNDVELPADFNQQLAALPTRADPVIWCPQTYFLSDRAKPSYTHGVVDLASFELSHGFDPTLTEIQFPRYYPAAATVWTRAAFERCGGFDERYFCYWEDVALSHRCQQLGIRLLPAPALRIHHLGRGTTGGKSTYSDHYRRGKELTIAILRKRD